MSQGIAVDASGIITEQEACRLLGPLLDELARVPQIAFAQYQAKIAGAFASPTGRFRSAAIQELMVQVADSTFTSSMQRYGARALLCAVPGLVVQFKKLNDRGLPQNYPTKTARRFARQGEVPGYPVGFRLTLGYVLDELGTEIADVSLVLQDGNRVVWSKSLLESKQTVLPIHTAAAPAPEIPAVAATTKPPKPKRQLTPKKAKNENDDKANDSSEE